MKQRAKLLTMILLIKICTILEVMFNKSRYNFTAP